MSGQRLFNLVPVLQQLLLIQGIKLACVQKRIPFICTHPFHPVSIRSLHHPEFRCSGDTPMAPFLTLQRDPARAAPHAPCRSSWHRRMVVVCRSSSKLSGWGVRTHPASDYSWISRSSVVLDHYLLFLPSLYPRPCEFLPKYKYLGEKENLFIFAVLVLSFQPVVLLLPALLSQWRGIIHTWTNDHIIDSLLLSWAPNYSWELTSLK